MNTIFAHFISHDENDAKRLAYAQWFIDVLPASEFSGDERLMYEYLKFSTELQVPVSFSYFQVWISTELRKVLKSTSVKVAGCETLRFEDPLSFETAFGTTRTVLSDDFNVLEQIAPPLEEFKKDITLYFSSCLKEKLQNALADTFELLNTSNDCITAADYAADKVQDLKDIYDITQLAELEEEANKSSGVQMEFVTDFGLPAIDADSGGLFTTQMLGIEAQSGTGKTRFALGCPIYRAITLYKKNVAFYAMEQSEAEVRAMLEARHMFEMFNVQISDDLIYKDKIPEEVKTMYEACKYDLWESGKYGKFEVFEDILIVEKLRQTLRKHDRLKGPFDLVAIDYMGLIESQPTGYSRVLDMAETIGTSLKYFKRYLRSTKKAGIAISQFNKEGAQAGEADKKITVDMAQGGMTVYRHTDYNIAISATEAMKLQQKRRLSQPKVRATAGFPSFIVDTRLGFCYWRQTQAKAV